MLKQMCFTPWKIQINNKDRYIVHRLICALIDNLTGGYRLSVVLKLEI